MSDKKYFKVAMPFVGVAERYIEADSEDEAIEIFQDTTTNPLDPSNSDISWVSWHFTTGIYEDGALDVEQNLVECEDASDEFE